jgi:hypothetical protein
MRRFKFNFIYTKILIREEQIKLLEKFKIKKDNKILFIGTYFKLNVKLKYKDELF